MLCRILPPDSIHKQSFVQRNIFEREGVIIRFSPPPLFIHKNKIGDKNCYMCTLLYNSRVIYRQILALFIPPPPVQCTYAPEPRFIHYWSICVGAHDRGMYCPLYTPSPLYIRPWTQAYPLVVHLCRCPWQRNKEEEGVNVNRYIKAHIDWSWSY